MASSRIIQRRGVLALMAGAMLLPLAGPASAKPVACVRSGKLTLANLPMATRARILVVKAPEVRERYSLPEWMDEKWTLIIHEGDMLVDRHLLMDATRSGPMDDRRAIHWPALFGPIPCTQPLAIIVDGNLKVNGSILNASATNSTSLIVTGQTRANSLLARGSYLSFGGPAAFDEAIYGQGPKGQILFSGPVYAPLLINSDHRLELRDKSGASSIGTYFNSGDTPPSAQPPATDKNGPNGRSANNGDSPQYARLPPAISAVVRPQLKSLAAIERAMLNGKPVLRQEHQGH